MSDVSLPQTLIVGHLWQSVALAAVLAGVLIAGRKMRGSTRYGLSAAAFLAALALPLAAFIPGETIVASLPETTRCAGGAGEPARAGRRLSRRRLRLSPRSRRCCNDVSFGETPAGALPSRPAVPAAPVARTAEACARAAVHAA